MATIADQPMILLAMLAIDLVAVGQPSSMKRIAVGSVLGSSSHFEIVSIASGVVGAIADFVEMTVAGTIAERIAEAWKIVELALPLLFGPIIHYLQLVRANLQNFVSTSVNLSIGLTLMLRTRLPMCKIRQPVAGEKQNNEKIVHNAKK